MFSSVTSAPRPSPASPALPVPGKTQQLTSPDQVPEGLAKSDWASIRAAYEAGRHAFQPTATGWQARNPGQQWTTTFDQRGFLAQPADGAWTWGLELRSYGFGESQRTIGGTPAVQAAGQRLSYQWDTTVQEWFVNGQRGLEQNELEYDHRHTEERHESDAAFPEVFVHNVGHDERDRKRNNACGHDHPVE